MMDVVDFRENLVVKYQGSRLDHELRAIESSSTNQTEYYEYTYIKLTKMEEER
jgi:hypothetical protein